MPDVTTIIIPEVVVPGHRLGRHVRHDPRSRSYRVGKTAKPTTTSWQRRIPILDQGNLGSCTGNATVGCLGSEPLFGTLDEAEKGKLNEGLAIEIYSKATSLDEFDGSYPPDDTGSDGLSVAKVATDMEFISGYQHIMSLDEAYAAIQDSPFIFGGMWMSDMDNPNSEGVVHPTGRARGGHEWLFRNYDATTGLWECDNSWGLSFGLNGSFKIPDEGVQWLMDQQGDATTFVPVTQPAPQPAPEPTSETFPWNDVNPWLKAPHLWRAATKAAKAVNAWKTKTGQ